MAHIFAGNRHKIEQHVLDAARTLDDEFWVIFEFQILGRDVDCLILKPNDEPGKTATIIVTELKNINDPIWGSWFGPWQINRGGQIESLVMSNAKDINPIQQAVNVTNEVSSWLHDNYTAYKEFGDVLLPEHKTKGYPFLLITTQDPNVRHRIDRPQTAYGSIFYTTDEWLRKIEGWNTNLSFPLSHADIARLVALLPVTPLEADEVVSNGHAEEIVTEPVPAASPLQTAGGEAGSLQWLAGFQQWALGLEARIASLEAQLSHGPKATPAPAPPVSRDLTGEEISAIVSAVQEIARVSGRRDFPTVIKSINYYLGHSLQESNYNGFGKARFFFDQAERQGIIQYGPLAGPAPTIYLADEHLPAVRSGYSLAVR
ncbi:MAG TPA: nuclease-related domain-containing protein [Thermomicrobiales bacterium]|nr:nuclease-related domain-containing protein [Thermomicrobiales bacterium]